MGFVKPLAKSWRIYVAQRAARLESDVRETFSLPAIERRLLTRVDGALLTLDARVRDRLAELAKKPRKRTRAKKPAPKARPARPSQHDLAA